MGFLVNKKCIFEVVPIFSKIWSSRSIPRRFLHKRKLLAPFFHKNSANSVEKSFFRFQFFCCLTPCIKKLTTILKKAVAYLTSWVMNYQFSLYNSHNNHFPCEAWFLSIFSAFRTTVRHPQVFNVRILNFVIFRGINFIIRNISLNCNLSSATTKAKRPQALACSKGK